MTQLLIDEPPLQVLPSLATKIGLNEAIVLQQFHYWLQHSNNVKDGYKWIYNSINNWAKQFPFWSCVTVKRAITHLVNQGYLITANYNKAGFDKTKWYRIDYEKLGMTQRLGQNDPTIGPNCTNGLGQNDPTNTNRLPENTSKTNTHNNVCANSQDETTTKSFFISKIWNKYPENRRGDFDNAFNSYLNSLSQDKPMVIINGISNYISCKKKANTAPRYWAILANLINQRLYINNYSNKHEKQLKVPYWQKPDYQPPQLSDDELAAMEKKNAELMKKMGLTKEKNNDK